MPTWTTTSSTRIIWIYILVSEALERFQLDYNELNEKLKTNHPIHN